MGRPVTELDKDGDPMDIQDLRDAVVEAAREWTHRVRKNDELTYPTAILDAIEALERAEKGET
jgi:hypothetical protein